MCIYFVNNTKFTYFQGKSHFLQVINDAEQLFFEIKNAIKEADRLFQMEQEQL